MTFPKIDEFPTCGKCKHANLYVPGWIYPHGNPKCELKKISVKHDDIACNEFKTWGMKIMTVRIKFKQEYYDCILNGDKTQTMRMSHKRIDVEFGEKAIAVFPDGKEINIRIIDVGYKAFKSINDDDAKREGFHNAEELKQELFEIYNEFRIEDYNRFYFYRFEVI